MAQAPILIIGNGISGISAAREIRKRSDQRIIVISDETPYMISRPALMYVYMGHMKAEHIEPYERSFWDKNNITLIHDRVLSLDTAMRQVTLSKGDPLTYDRLVLATGSKSRRLGLDHEDVEGVVSLYHWHDLQKIERLSHAFGTPAAQHKITSAVITGGGLIGVELAEMLHTRGIQVTMIVRDSHFWGSVVDAHEGRLIQKQLDNHHIRTIYSSSVSRIIAQQGKLDGVVLNTGEELSCQMLGVTIGVEPNTALAAASGIECQRGVLVDSYLQTSAQHVYAIGDCAQLRAASEGRKTIEAVWYAGKMMGETVALTLTGNAAAYHPGIWFNSAKFFHLEYQTYGNVWPQSGSDQVHLHWSNNTQTKGIKLAYHPNTMAFLGINAWGLRIRQDKAFEAIRQGIHIQQLLDQLELFNFDAEFTPSAYGQMAESLRNQIPTSTPA